MEIRDEPVAMYCILCNKPETFNMIIKPKRIIGLQQASPVKFSLCNPTNIICSLKELNRRITVRMSGTVKVGV
ncbi:unnamed protein product [Gongylonema pulchrum]|uniref:MSP domain-containing protein n=1 Tax=Gongylonema pulchrum TaxID=637853 RepID=A0A183DNN4_9BILA|nr:unnamed protein product [Gongylonema pulchrum]